MKTDTFKMPAEMSYDFGCTDISTQEEDNFTDIREPVPTDDQDVNESSLIYKCPYYLQLLNNCRSTGTYKFLICFSLERVKEKKFLGNTLLFSCGQMLFSGLITLIPGK